MQDLLHTLAAATNAEQGSNAKDTAVPDTAENQDDNEDDDENADENSSDEDDSGNQLSNDENPEESAGFNEDEDPNEISEENQDERDISDEDLDQDPSLAKEEGMFCFFNAILPVCNFNSILSYLDEFCNEPQRKIVPVVKPIATDCHLNASWNNFLVLSNE